MVIFSKLLFNITSSLLIINLELAIKYLSIIDIEPFSIVDLYSKDILLSKDFL